MDMTQMERANGTLKQRLLITLKKWKSRGPETAKEELVATKSNEGEEVTPPYTV